jgi:hypothetical protein
MLQATIGPATTAPSPEQLRRDIDELALALHAKQLARDSLWSDAGFSTPLPTEFSPKQVGNAACPCDVAWARRVRCFVAMRSLYACST